VGCSFWVKGDDELLAILLLLGWRGRQQPYGMVGWQKWLLAFLEKGGWLEGEEPSFSSSLTLSSFCAQKLTLRRPQRPYFRHRYSCCARCCYCVDGVSVLVDVDVVVVGKVVSLLLTRLTVAAGLFLMQKPHLDRGVVLKSLLGRSCRFCFWG
jgi:hypothetical protein